MLCLSAQQPMKYRVRPAQAIRIAHLRHYRRIPSRPHLGPRPAQLAYFGDAIPNTRLDRASCLLG